MLVRVSSTKVRQFAEFLYLTEKYEDFFCYVSVTLALRRFLRRLTTVLARTAWTLDVRLFAST